MKSSMIKISIILAIILILLISVAIFVLDKVVFQSTRDTNSGSNFGHPFAAWIQDAVSHPKAMLYPNESFKGKYEIYDYEKAEYEGGCENVMDLMDELKSVKIISGICIRLFHSPVCQGWSLAIYPGSENSRQVLNAKLTKVGSIGPCVPEEFTNSIFEDKHRTRVVKIRNNSATDFPDLVEFHSEDKYERGVDLYNPRARYFISKATPQSHSRIEFSMYQILHNQSTDMRWPKVDKENLTLVRELDARPGDVVGYALPATNNVTNLESFAVFPLSPAGLEGWGKVFEDIRLNFDMGNIYDVLLSWNFMYEDDRQLRPCSFYYWVSYHRIGSDKNKVSYGRILN